MDRQNIDLKHAQIAIEVTSYCNLRCGMCPLKTMKRGFVHMDFNLLKKLHREVRELDIKVGFLHDMGEPLLYPHIIDALNLFPEVTLSTHGGLLKDDMARRILETSLEHIRICIDTVDPVLYPRIRIRGEFDVVVENIRRFLDIAKDHPIDIQIQRLVTKLTLHESRGDFVRFFNLRKYGNARVIDKSCMPLDTSDSTELHGISAGCPMGGPLNWFVVLADGSVTHCCFDYEGRQLIGNVNDRTIAEIAQSQRVQEIQLAFQNQDLVRLPRCAECFKHKGEVITHPTWLYRLVRQLPLKKYLRKRPYGTG